VFVGDKYQSLVVQGNGISQALESFCDTLSESPAILIGTGRLGKTDVLSKRDDVYLIDSLQELHEYSSDGADEYPVIDSLYRIIAEYSQSTITDHKDTFEEILDVGHIDDDTPVGAVMRPWSYEYVCSDDVSQFGDAIMDWSRHYATISKEDAIEIGTRLTDLPETTVEEYVRDVYFEFDIDTDAVKYSYSTYIPHLFLDLTHDDDGYLPPGVVCSTSDGTSGQLTGTLRDFGRDLFKSASLSNIQSASKRALKKLKSTDSETFIEFTSKLDRDTLPDDVVESLSEIDLDHVAKSALKTVGNEVPGAYPVLLLILYYTGQEDERIGTFEDFQHHSSLLLGDAVPTPTKELIETNLELEPYTLESVNQLASEDTVAKLRILQVGLQNMREDTEGLSQEISDIMGELETLEERIRTFETDLAELRLQFDEFEAHFSEHTIKHPEIVDAKFERSLLEIDHLEERLLQQESRYLASSGDTSHDLTNLPRDRTIERETTKQLQDNQIVILRGSIGTGKTTSAYHTLAALDRSGAFVGLPNFEKSGYDYIRHALERVEERPRYLFVSYRLGFPAIDNRTQVRNLLELVNNNLCDKLIIECRDEVYQSLLNDGGDAAQGHQGLPSIWRSRETVACSDISCETANEIVSWVYNQHNIDNSIVGNEVLATDRLTEKFGHNPEFLKIAARLSATGESVDNVETIGELIELDIRSLLSNFEEKSEWYREFIELLALTRGLSIDRATDILGESIRNAEIVELTEALDGYVDFPDEAVRNTPATLSPDIYTDLLFQHWFVEEHPPELLVAHVRDLLEGGYDDLIPDVLLNLSLAYTRADDGSIQRKKISTAASDSLERLDTQTSPDNYLHAISNLGSIPLRAEIIAWSNIEATLTQDFLENMWDYRVYSEMVVGSVLDEDYDESIDIITTLGRLLSSQFRVYDRKEAEDTLGHLKRLLWEADDKYQWSNKRKDNLPADLLTYLLVESARSTAQRSRGSTVPPELDQILELFDDLNNEHTVHAEAASQLYSISFVALEGQYAPNELYERLSSTFDEVSPHLHETAKRSNLFEPKGHSDWSGASSVFLRRFHLEISLTTGLEGHPAKFEKWITFIWKSIGETLEFCNQPARSLFAAVRTIFLGAAIRQEMLLGDNSDILSRCTQTMLTEISPRQLPPSELLLSQWFSDHPESWYARLLEVTLTNLISQDQNESFGDDLLYRIAGEEAPTQEELVGTFETITNQIYIIYPELEDEAHYKREVCYAWYRALVLHEEPSQSNPYYQCVETQAETLLDYGESKYLSLWVVAASDVQNRAGSMIDPYGTLSPGKLMSETNTHLLAWLEVFMKDNDALLAASRFSREHFDGTVEDVEALLTEIIGIVASASTNTLEGGSILSGSLEEVYKSSDPFLENIQEFTNRSNITGELSREMRSSLFLANSL